MTLTRFCDEVVGVDVDQDGWAWPTNHEETCDRLDNWLRTQRERAESIASERTVRTKRSRLATYVRAYTERWTDDLLAAVADPDQQADAYDMVQAVYDDLDENLDSAASKYKVHRVVDEFYRSLARSGRAAFNPVDGLMDVYKWDADAGDGGVEALDAAQMRRLYRAAETTEEELLILALGAWGLRRAEVAALHRDQLVLDPEPNDADGPYIGFETQKNGPGTVTLLYGLEVVRDRLDALTDEWTVHTAGYLFPSHQSASGHVTGTTVYNRFRDIAARANVHVDGDLPTPKYCRRFWYDAYTSVMDEVTEILGSAAAEQGSASADVLQQSYVEAATIRELRRDRMREELADVFEGESS
jgi:integrase